MEGEGAGVQEAVRDSTGVRRQGVVVFFFTQGLGFTVHVRKRGFRIQDLGFLV